VLAHVRDASVGRVALVNTHPFVEGQWVFAHNGTVARYRKSRTVRQALLAAISPDRQRRLTGETDSERCFQLFLTRLEGRGSLLKATLAQVKAALRATTEVVQRIADRPSSRPSSLNFLVSDGRVLAASRLGRTLQVSDSAGEDGAFVVASEPIGHAEWKVVPEGAVVGFDGSARIGG
jgi:glutamine amidotransferase